MSTILETTLVRTRDVCGGRHRRHATVGHIVWLSRQGLSAEQIVEQHPQRTLGEIYTVLAWYYDHREAFDAEMAEDNERDEAASRRWTDKAS